MANISTSSTSPHEPLKKRKIIVKEQQTSEPRYYIYKPISWRGEFLFYKSILLSRMTKRHNDETNCFEHQNQGIRVQMVNEKEYLIRDNKFYYNLADPVEFVATKKNVKQYPLTSPRSAKVISQFIHQLIYLLMKSSNYQLYSKDSIFFIVRQEKTEKVELKVNLLSFVGMELLFNNEEISKDKFKQIYQILGRGLLNEPIHWRKLTTVHKHRAIGMILLQLVLGKEISLLDSKKWAYFEKQRKSGRITLLEQYQRLLEDLPSRFKDVLTHPKVKEEFDQIESKLYTRYYQFLMQVFVEEKELTWEDTMRYLCQKWKLHIPEQNPRFYSKLWYSLKEKKHLEQTLGKQKLELYKDLGISPLSNLKSFLIVSLGHEEYAYLMMGYERMQDFLEDAYKDILFLGKKQHFIGKLIQLLSSLFNCSTEKVQQFFQLHDKQYSTFLYNDKQSSPQPNPGETRDDGKGQSQKRELSIGNLVSSSSRLATNYTKYQSDKMGRKFIEDSYQSKMLRKYDQLLRD